MKGEKWRSKGEGEKKVLKREKVESRRKGKEERTVGDWRKEGVKIQVWRGGRWVISFGLPEVVFRVGLVSCAQV